MSTRDAAAGLVLAAHATVDDASLTVDFSVENRGASSVTVYLHPDDGRRAAVLPGAYVCALRGERELRLLLAPPPPPRHYFVPRGVVPLARSLEPGERYEGRIELSRPAREWTAYVPFRPPEDADPLVVDHGVLCVGFFPSDDRLWVEPGPEEGTVWTQGSELHTAEARFDLDTPVEVVETLDASLRW